MNKPHTVILHCAATPDSDDPKHDFGVKDIDKWHRERGWEGCGYHFVIRRNGQIESGRPIEKVGAHTLGHNQDSIGICYVGTYLPTPMQWESIFKLYGLLRDEYNIRWPNWFGHREFDSHKECPGFDPGILRRMLKLLG